MTTVFLHPMGLDGKCWQFTGLRGIRLDLPGHGRSPLPAAPLTIESAAEAILGTVEGPVDIVGLSLGGTLGTRMALMAPGRVRSLLIACSGVLDAPERRARLLERADSVDRVGMAGVLDSTLERWFTAPALAAPHHRGVSYARRRLLADDARAFALWWRALGAHTVRDEIGRIGCPVTVLAGRHDAAASVEHLLELFDAFQGPRRMEILPGPHMLPLEAPTAFADAVRRHLRWAQSGVASQAGGRAMNSGGSDVVR
jgi:3-oxoadipate enol-lactonase